MRYDLRPAKMNEINLFYSDAAECRDERLGTVGHIRADFGGGKEFWSTWWQHNDDKLNTQEFKNELDKFVNSLRQDGLLKDLDSMRSYCQSHADGAINDRVYCYTAESSNYRYCIRCTPEPGEYHAYIYAYDKRRQEQVKKVYPESSV